MNYFFTKNLQNKISMYSCNQRIYFGYLKIEKFIINIYQDNILKWTVKA